MIWPNKLLNPTAKALARHSVLHESTVLNRAQYLSTVFYCECANLFLEKLSPDL